MKFSELNTKLVQLTDREQYYKQHQQLSIFYDQLEKTKVNGEFVYVFDNMIPKYQHYQVLKHTRFIPVPYHIHSFIELNYIYSGTCTQIIDGKKVTLTKGQICLIDTAVPHSIENTTEEDIIINILLTKDYFTKQLSKDNFDKGIVLDFILTALSNKHSHDQYIVFKNKEDNHIRRVIEEILFENYANLIGCNHNIENLISILFTWLVRDFDYETNKTSANAKEQILEILHYIEDHYLELTLQKLAETFNYTPAYLSFLIHHGTGKKFSDLILEKKLEQAQTLIRSTSQSITSCAAEAGFTNITFFYKKYQTHYGKKPSSDRL